MSTIDKLKQAQMQRTEGTVPVGDCPRDFKKVVVPADEIKSTVPAGTLPRNSNLQTSRISTNWLIGLILFILIIANLAFTFKLFIMTKEYDTKGNNSQKNLNIVGKIVTDHANKIGSLSSGLSQLEKQVSSQDTTIEKLIKANNAMFGRTKLLESKLDQILKQTK
jgi:hypothetical protein